MRKQSALIILLVTLSLALSGILTGCAPRAGAGTASTAASDFVVDLPSIVLDYDKDGQVSLFGLPAANLGIDLTALTVKPETVAAMQTAGIQHLAIVNQPSALRIYVNNKPGLALLMDADSRAALKNILPLVGEETESLGGLIELLPGLGVGLVMKFPAAAGKAEIKLQSPTSVPTAKDDAAVLQKARTTKPTVALTLDYNAQGIPAIGGINPLMMGMFGLKPEMMQLPTSAVESVGGMGIQSVAVTTLPNSLLLALNDSSLPLITWSDVNTLMSLLNVLAKSQEVDPAQLQQLPTLLSLPVVLSAKLSFPK